MDGKAPGMSANTHFNFHHKVFSVDGSYFSAEKGGVDARFNVPMGDLTASIPIDSLRREFGIAGDSEDGRLLTSVSYALKYVNVVCVHDAIPNELIDGTASWSVDDRHRLISRCRLAYQLVTWVMGDEEGKTELADFIRQIENPEIKAKIREAIEKMAQELGITEDAVGTIERRLGILAHELSYIEGLRDRFREIQEIEATVEDMAAVDGQGQRILEESERILVLLPLAYKRIESEFDVMFKQCENIVKMLGKLKTYVDLIRKVRDNIRVELQTWNEVVENWHAYTAKKGKLSAAQITERTYHFLAQNYPINQIW